MKWSSSGIQPTTVFHLASRILEGKASLSSLTIAQVTADLPAIKDPKEAAKQQARLVAQAIESFDAHISDDKGLTTFYDSSKSAMVAYISDVAARPAYERRNIRPGVVRMMNDTKILVVSRAGAMLFRLHPSV